MKTNIELYKIFYTVASQESVTAASEILFVSQPAVSQSIKQLEMQLGVQLFLRKPKGMELSKAGETLFHYIEQAYHLIDRGEKQIKDQSGLFSGELHVSAGDTACRKILLPVIKSFHEQYPGIQLHVTNRTTRQTIDLLKSGKIDLGLVALPVDTQYIKMQSVFTVHDCFVCNKEMWEQIHKPATLENIQKYPLLLLEEGTITRVSQESQFIKKGILITPEIELGSLDLLVDFAKIGMGIACVPEEFYLNEINAEEILPIPMKEPMDTRSFAIAWRKDIPLSKPQKEFIAYMQSS